MSFKRLGILFYFMVRVQGIEPWASAWKALMFNVIAVTAVLAVNRIDVLPLLPWAAAPITCTPPFHRPVSYTHLTLPTKA